MKESRASRHRRTSVSKRLPLIILLLRLLISVTFADQVFWLDDNETATTDFQTQITAPEQVASPGLMEVDVCAVCWCNKKDSLSCKRENRLNAIPELPLKADRTKVTEM